MPISISYPFYPATGSLGYFESSQTKLEAVSSNIRSLLVTNYGERVMHADFGCNLIEFVFEQKDDPALRQRIAERIKQQLSRWLPFVTLRSLFIVMSKEDSAIPENGFRISMQFSVGNQSGNLSQLIS